MEQKYFRIFLASSNEMSEDRKEFGNFIRQLDMIYSERGIKIKVFEWEDQDAPITNRRTQDSYNDEVRKSDMFIAMFYKKAGKYTIEEFNVAMAEYIKEGYPRVYVFCKTLKEGEKEEPELREFKERLNEEHKEKFWISFNNQDDFQLRFVQQFLWVENDLMKLKLEGDKVTLDGLYIAELAKLSFIAGNKNYIQLKEELENLPKDIETARKRTEKYPDDEDLRSELQKKLNRYNNLKDEFALLQKELFKTSQRIAVMQREQLSDKLCRATEAFEMGNLERANTLLDEISHDADTHYANIKRDQELVHQDINAFLLQAKMMIAEVNVPLEERINEVKAIYVKADKWAKESNFPEEKYEGLLSDYSNFLFDYGQYKEMEPICLRLVSLREKLYGPDHLSIAGPFDNIGIAHNSQRDFLKALECHFKALAIRVKVLGMEHLDIAGSFDNIGLVYQRVGDYPRALEFLFKSLAIKVKFLGTGHLITAGSYNNISGVYFDDGDYAKALEYIFKTLDIQEMVLGKENPETAGTYNNIGLIYETQREYSKALDYHFKALSIREKVYGKDHPFTAGSYNNISGVYFSNGEYCKALEYLRKALDIFEHVLGPDHSNTKMVKRNMEMCQFLCEFLSK